MNWAVLNNLARIGEPLQELARTLELPLPKRSVRTFIFICLNRELGESPSAVLSLFPIIRDLPYAGNRVGWGANL